MDLELHTQLNDPLVMPLVKRFSANLMTEVSVLSKYVNNRDWKETARQAHKLDGVTSSYGFPSVSQLFKKINTEAKKECVAKEAVECLLKEADELSRRIFATYRDQF